MALTRPTILGDGFSRIFLGDPADPAVRFARSADPGSIADAVIDLIEDPVARHALAESGERFVRERLSWARAAAETIAVYRAALSVRDVRGTGADHSAGGGRTAAHNG
jgi:glycosyltransferase involved in cell wall biosynthesis